MSKYFCNILRRCVFFGLGFLAGAPSHAFVECSTYLAHPNPDTASGIWELCEALNQDRAQAGHGALWLNRDLHLVAQRYAEEMRSKAHFSHIGLDGRNHYDRIVQAGINVSRPYEYQCAENIAFVPVNFGSGAASVTELWMNSPPHREALLYPWFNQVGIGFAYPYWVALFSN